jgi:hypothetical protein
MDPLRFDRLAKTLSAPGTRRRLVRLLLGVPLAGSLAGLLAMEQADAETPLERVRDRAKRKQEKRHNNDGNNNGGNKGNGGNGNKGNKGKGRGCKPNCAGTACGGLDNGCGGVCACGEDCDCLAGQNCLPNGSCATRCSDANPTCTASGCVCSGAVEGGPACRTENITVDSCAGGCPLGSACVGASVCVELCRPQTP